MCLSQPVSLPRPGRLAAFAAACLCVCVLLWAQFARAADEAIPALHDYAIDMWTSRQGLPHNTIRTIAQTPEGRMWFGTWEGLVAYNGVEFDVLDRSAGLLDNGIGAVLVDQGGLWFGDSRGNLGFRDAQGRLTFLSRPPHLPNVLIQAMAKDEQGRLWLVYEGKGLATLEPDGTFQYFPPGPDSPLTAASVHVALVGQRLWIGTFGGLAYSDGDGIAQRVPEGFGLPAGYVWPYLAPDGTLWIAAEDRIYRMVDGQPQFVRQLPERGRITSMLQDRRGQLWVGTETKGVLRVSALGVEPFPADSSLPGGRITALLEDAEGSIWAGASGGLFRLRETLFHTYTRNNGLSGDYVRAVIEDSRGRLWIGTSTGLDRMDADGSIHPQPLPTASGQPVSVLSLAEDEAGSLWIGSYVDGVYRLDPEGTVGRYGTEQGVPAGNIRTIAVGNGTVWLGTQRGVVRLDMEGEHAGTARHVSGSAAPTGLITGMELEGDVLWVGTIEGVRVLRGDRFERIDLQSLGGGRSVYDFRRLGSDMWIMSDRGLYRYREGTLARVGLEQGVPVDSVFRMMPDQQGNLWLTSNRGVMRTTQAELDAVADGRAERITMERYAEIDGMANSQANGSSGPPGWVRRDGTVCIATAGGLAVVDPARIPRLQERTPPPVVIERIAVDGRTLPPGHDETRLSLPGGKRLAVDYIGLSYLMPERIVYRTRLDGLDTDWIERGRQHAVEYIGLPPGDYTLRVAAAHPGGKWGEREAVRSFRIEPFWWQRLDVRLLGTLLALFAISGLYAFGVSRYRTANERLERLVNERTIDLLRQTERLKHSDEEKSALLEQLREKSEAFERQAREDSLTGLPNRRAFLQALAREMEESRRSGRPLTLAMLDVDHFKLVNDHHSHAAGDAVLQEVGRLLRECVRFSGLPARLGGEEFALLLPDTSLAQAYELCERVRKRFHTNDGFGGVDGLRVTFSAGIAQWRGGAETDTQLMHRADTALYRAKQAGRDRCVLG